MYKMKRNFAFKIFLISFVFGNISSNELIVNTTSGPIRGILHHWKEITYKSYLGIPYAEKPTGPLRFKPPVPKRPWTAVFNASSEGPVCPQGPRQYKREQMSEDCLFLNIHVPADIKKRKMPIFVFIHGGAFRLLSGDGEYLYRPEFFLQRGIIFIAMNFRLGVLGYLNLGIKEASGNAALKDILLSLKWIKDNIERFDGEPNKITIGGHSSGATIAHYLLLTEQSTGLFQQAIMISGNALCHRSISRYAKENAYILAEELGLTTQNDQLLLEQLRQVAVFDIVDAEMTLKTKYDKLVLRPFAMFIPSIEIQSDHAVITSDPLEISKSGLKQNIPIITGFNYNEGIYAIKKIRKNPDKYRDLQVNMELAIPSNIEYPIGSNVSKALAKSIGEKYFDKDLCNYTLSNVVDLISDSQYFYSTDLWINIHKGKNNSNNLYYYIFDFDGDLNWAKLKYEIDFPGTSHADELGYIFATPATAQLLKTASINTLSVVNILTNLFSNFIKYGNPTPDTCTTSFGWPDYSENKTILTINDKPSKGTMPKVLKDRISFWNDIFDEYYSYVVNHGELHKKLIP